MNDDDNMLIIINRILLQSTYQGGNDNNTTTIIHWCCTVIMICGMRHSAQRSTHPTYTPCALTHKHHRSVQTFFVAQNVYVFIS